MPRRPALVLLALLAAAPAARAQTDVLDVVDGETLFDGGWLVSLGSSLERREGLRDGTASVSDPLDRRVTTTTASLAVSYGLRHDLQLTAIAPWVHHEIELSDPSGPDRLSTEGFGDVAALAKWRVYRWDAPHKALNVSLLGGIELPTGDDDQSDRGVLLPLDLQPGTGSYDPLLGAAATYEPRRWRYNAAVLKKWNNPNDDGFRLGDELLAELSVGNRFWLEPYPGPFSRLDLFVRYRREGADDDGSSLLGEGRSRRVDAGFNLAFRPRPSIDLQLALEVPVYERTSDARLENDFAVTFKLGFRR